MSITRGRVGSTRRHWQARPAKTTAANGANGPNRAEPRLGPTALIAIDDRGAEVTGTRSYSRIRLLLSHFPSLRLPLPSDATSTRPQSFRLRPNSCGDFVAGRCRPSNGVSRSVSHSGSCDDRPQSPNDGTPGAPSGQTHPGRVPNPAGQLLHPPTSERSRPVPARPGVGAFCGAKSVD